VTSYNDIKGVRIKLNNIAVASLYTPTVGLRMEPEYVTLIWDANGGTISRDGSVRFTLRRQIPGTNIRTRVSPIRNGWEFDGWYTNVSGGDRLTNWIVPQRDTTYYAQWRVEVTITWDARNGSTPTSSTRTFNPNTPLGYQTIGSVFGALPEPRKEGYRFYGWYTENGSKINANTYAPTRNTTYVAHWSQPLPECLTEMIYDSSHGGGALAIACAIQSPTLKNPPGHAWIEYFSSKGKRYSIGTWGAPVSNIYFNSKQELEHVGPNSFEICTSYSKVVTEINLKNAVDAIIQVMDLYWGPIWTPDRNCLWFATLIWKSAGQENLEYTELERTEISSGGVTEWILLLQSRPNLLLNNITAIYGDQVNQGDYLGYKLGYKYETESVTK